MNLRFSEKRMFPFVLAVSLLAILGCRMEEAMGMTNSEEVTAFFKDHPNTLWIPVTAPPLNKHSTSYDKSEALNAWAFNEWLKGEFMEEYRNTSGLNNIAIFDLFGEVLANPKSDPYYPGALKDQYVKSGSDSHPNAAGGEAAESLYRYLFSPEAAEVFRKHGFAVRARQTSAGL